MPLQTTCIGAYPKPDSVQLPDWFNIPAGPDTAEPTKLWVAAMDTLGTSARRMITAGIQEVITDQVDAGIDVPTDGEVIRENYIHYHCRHLHGFDFDDLTEKELRGGTYSAQLPTIIGPVSAKGTFLIDDWKLAQQFTDKPVKITMPGPLTISDTNVDAFYNNPAKLGADVADALNREVRELAEAGCQHIQIDEPVFARHPNDALTFGMENLERAWHGCPTSVTRTVHMCCGYPDRIDHPDYPKADQSSYQQLADAIDYASFNVVSLEDAHRHNDLSLLEQFNKTSVVLGAVAIAKSRLETVEEIRERLLQALQHIDHDRLIAAPDCGLGLLTRELAIAKLTNLCRAAKSV